MTTVNDMISWLLPYGSTRVKDGSLQSCPSWPPDLFAVAASLIEASDAYVRLRYSASGSDDFAFTRRFCTTIHKLGESWSKTYQVPAQIQSHWENLLRQGHSALYCDTEELLHQTPPDNKHDRWIDCAFFLMLVADEASWGIGFYPSSTPAALYFKFYAEYYQEKQRRIQLPDSICAMVPADRVCIQPKTNTPQTGCTLRSLSHHLALLPPRGVVRTRWHLAERPPSHQPNAAWTGSSRYNLLLVPFPFRIRERAVEAARLIESPPARGGKGKKASRVVGEQYGFFRVSHDWLIKERPQAAHDLSRFLRQLIDVAREDCGEVHGLVMPEGALDPELAVMLAKGLEEQNPDNNRLRWFVTGVAGEFREGDKAWSNWAQYFRYDDSGRLHRISRQKKHHRWCLDSPQIDQYGLGRVLDSAVRWWEEIDLEPRTCNFYVLRSGASMTAIVCEDLARQDPVTPALRAVGPNLLIALLMDGPQLTNRWPARYALALADDPGCSVLTLTSLGMVRRSSAPKYGDRREIALWKGAGGATQELKLPAGDHALLLSLNGRQTVQHTLDGRTDDGTTIQFDFVDAYGVRAREGPAWLQLD